MKDNIIIDIVGYDKVLFKEGGTLEELLKKIDAPKNIIAAIIDNELVELNFKLKEDTSVKLISTNDRQGSKMYRNGLKFLYITAIKELFGSGTDVRLRHSLDKGIYTTIDMELNSKVIEEIKEKMLELVEKDLEIEKVTTSRKEAIKYFEGINEMEKADMYKQMTSDVVSLYSLLDYYNYFFTPMPIRTGILREFDLTLTKDNGVMLEYPDTFTGSIPKYNHMEKVLNVFTTYGEWSNKLGVNYVSDVNDVVINGKIKEFVELNEIKQNDDLNKIASMIEKNIKDIKLVLIAGPSSSGKTTTSKKLSLYLKNRGINPFVISTDDYFKDRKDTPKNEKGEYEFDILDALDIDLFNEQITKLLNNEKVIIPTYNFLTGEKEYKNKEISIEDRDLIIIEGIHTLNEKLTLSIPRKNKFKIYISPFTPLGLDRHNHVSTVDLRLIRRLVRDYRTRGYSGEATLKGWPLVRKSEEEYIFPYQKEADVVLNTALIYELGILKTFAIPILQSVDYKSDYYIEAIRIINFLKYFLDIPVTTLPSTALLREFVGGGYFE